MFKEEINAVHLQSGIHLPKYKFTVPVNRQVYPLIAFLVPPLWFFVREFFAKSLLSGNFHKQVLPSSILTFVAE